mmetsp:Transcript_37767/g.84209  ORF Transcript_37767/g.84209 Transcript_37767/m.84209 type:complete len:334 (-) Transcript_37767:610-1611(-)
MDDIALWELMSITSSGMEGSWTTSSGSTDKTDLLLRPDWLDAARARCRRSSSRSIASSASSSDDENAPALVLVLEPASRCRSSAARCAARPASRSSLNAASASAASHSLNLERGRGAATGRMLAVPSWPMDTFRRTTGEVRVRTGEVPALLLPLSPAESAFLRASRLAVTSSAVGTRRDTAWCVKRCLLALSSSSPAAGRTNTSMMGLPTVRELLLLLLASRECSVRSSRCARPPVTPPLPDLTFISAISRGRYARPVHLPNSACTCSRWPTGSSSLAPAHQPCRPAMASSRSLAASAYCSKARAACICCCTWATESFSCATDSMRLMAAASP